MFKVKENDIFEKNMNNHELHQTWVKMKLKQEINLLGILLNQSTVILSLIVQIMKVIYPNQMYSNS